MIHITGQGAESCPLSHRGSRTLSRGLNVEVRLPRHDLYIRPFGTLRPCSCHKLLSIESSGHLSRCILLLELQFGCTGHTISSPPGRLHLLSLCLWLCICRQYASSYVQSCVVLTCAVLSIFCLTRVLQSAVLNACGMSHRTRPSCGRPRRSELPHAWN